MYVTVRLRCDAERLWDTIEVYATDGDQYIRFYEREIYLGDDHANALSKAITEYGALLTKLDWLEPGSTW